MSCSVNKCYIPAQSNYNLLKCWIKIHLYSLQFNCVILRFWRVVLQSGKKTSMILFVYDFCSSSVFSTLDMEVKLKKSGTSGCSWWLNQSKRYAYRTYQTTPSKASSTCHLAQRWFFLKLSLWSIKKCNKAKMKMKSKAPNPFLEKNLIIFPIIKTQWNVLAHYCLKLYQNPTNSATKVIFRIILHHWTGKSHAGVIWPICSAKRRTHSPAEPVILWKYYELLPLVSSPRAQP